MAQGFIIEPLGSHDRGAFSCGVALLDRYLQQQASQDMRRMVAACFVAVEVSSQKVAGFYTLAATSILAADLPNDVLKKLPRYPVLPGALIGRLAVDAAFARRGLGGAMLADATLRAARADTRAFAVLVDAKDDVAVRFYETLGFKRFVSRPASLFLPLRSARA